MESVAYYPCEAATKLYITAGNDWEKKSLEAWHTYLYNGPYSFNSSTNVYDSGYWQGGKEV